LVTLKRDRYIAFKILSESNKIKESSLKLSVWDTYKTLFGISESSGSGLYFENYNDVTKLGIVRCNHKALVQILTVLAILTRIDRDEILIQIINVSGTINKAKKSLVTK